MARRWSCADFPVGFADLHPDIAINFQLNRLYNFSNDERLLQQLRDVATRINGYPAMVRELTELGHRNEREGGLLRAALCYRGAEFVTDPASPERERLRASFRELSNAYYGVSDHQHHVIPYAGLELSAYRFAPEGPQKETVVFLNGFDGHLEELTRMFLVFRDVGYEVIAFDGPGQGAVLETFGAPMTPAWECPTGAVLDHFGVSDVTVIGCSLGGGLAVRAAAYEPRIARVICFDVLPDLFGSVTHAFPAPVRPILERAIPSGAGRWVFNAALRRAARRDLLLRWGLEQGMHVMGQPTPYDFIRATLAFRTVGYSSRLTQDVLLLAGTNDHYVPLSHLYDQMRALTRVRSLTTRTFTPVESAANHCQLGNLGLALRTMLDWLDAADGDAHTAAAVSR